MLKIYSFLTWLLIPAILFRLYWRSLKSPLYRQRIKERFGVFNLDIPENSIWIHAVSVGEAQAIAPLVRYILEELPESTILITTTTPTGSARVKTLFSDDVFHVYFPYDLNWSVNAFLDRIKPGMLLMVETEIWPNLLTQCQHRNIPTLLANARLSERSARSYARFQQFSETLFSKITCIAAQSQADADRFVQLGTKRDNIEVTGSIKFDVKTPASIQEETQVIRRLWGEDRPVWVAASTHEGEEEILLNTHRKLCTVLPEALLVLVPRHPERFEQIATLIKKQKFSLRRRSEGKSCSLKHQVFLGDSMGDLPIFLGAADVAFIGGSLVPTGGHNMLEASSQGVPVIFGPHVHNFSKIAQLLIDAKAAQQVDSEEELSDLLSFWLSNASERSITGENGRLVVDQNKGALSSLIRIFKKTWTKS